MADMHFLRLREAEESEIKVLAGLVSPEASVLVVHMTTFSLCPYTDFSL